MAESASKKKSQAGAKESVEPEKPAPVEKLILDRKFGKYGVIALISFWAKELRKREEHRHLSQTEVLDLAMTEILGGKVDEKEVLKLLESSHSPADGKSADGPAKGDKKG